MKSSGFRKRIILENNHKNNSYIILEMGGGAYIKRNLKKGKEETP